MSKPTKFGSITISGRGKDEAGRFFIAAEWKGSDGEAITAAIPERELLTANKSNISRVVYDLFQTTIDTSETNNLLQHLNTLGQTPSTLCVRSKLGWDVDKNAFLKPGRLIGASDRLVVNVKALSGSVAGKFSVRGSLEKWKADVAPLIHGNSRLTLGLVLAFTGPVIQLMGEEQFMVCLLGGAGQGKTTVASVASMTWGAHKDTAQALNLGAGETFKSTINALDEVYAAHSGCFLFLDELSTYLVGSNRHANALPELVRSHNDGKGKKRLTDETPPPSWLVPVLVTSNEGLAQLSPALGVENRDAIRDRYIEIPAPADAYGMFEDLHGAKTLGDFVVGLKNAALANAGAPAEAFLERLVARVNLVGADAVLGNLTGWKGDFMAAAKGVPSRQRVKRRFSVMYAAGRAAIAAKVLPFKAEELEEALLICLRDHLDALGTEEAMPSSLSDVVRALSRYYRKHKKAMPDVTKPNLTERGHDPDTCPGYVKTTKTNGTELILQKWAFADAMANVADTEDAKRLLREADLVVVQREGPQARTSVKRTIGKLEDGSKWEISAIAIKLDQVLNG